MRLTLGFSPCPNDTFMFAALVNQWIDTGGIDFTVYMDDVEQLNLWAGSSRLDITKMSFHRSLDLGDFYQLLSSGAALGKGCGPLLISTDEKTTEEILRGPVALPGQWTTAHLLFNQFYPGCQNKIHIPFNAIEEVVSSKKVVAGVIIHENRFTYASKGLKKIIDLGEAWEHRTGLPIPLGGIFAHRRLDHDVISQVQSLIRSSIEFAFANLPLVMPYVRKYASEMEEEVMKQHIQLYVNDFSLDLGDSGRKAVEALKKI